MGFAATTIYVLLSNQRHNASHPVIWIEWLLSTLFDASLLTPEPPMGGSFFCAWCLVQLVHLLTAQGRMIVLKRCTLKVTS
jgi:hypothetical protein